MPCTSFTACQMIGDAAPGLRLRAAVSRNGKNGGGESIQSYCPVAAAHAQFFRLGDRFLLS
ncbi:hypothetical protein RR42_s0886 [Cupriavidus basilensis]|uniref:Uncharacterized protein n=1 Tax=Cupriavidus basilensis TaxID=68895 RepID=A0A0C4YPG6_9BURK|nr:hypothetical protein RR42_s0886 [Cupriavidus basilensis]